MSRFPSMPLFIDAYLADTTHFSAEEHGAYLLLLMAMWRRNGWVPNDDRDLARICCINVRRWPRVKKRLIPLLIQKDGELSQRRLSTVFTELRNRKAQKRSSDRPSKTKQNNSLATTPSRDARASSARDLSPSPDTNTNVFVKTRVRAKKPKPQNPMIEEIDRRLAALKEGRTNGDDVGYLLLPPARNH